jgi:hypothetical protein
VFIWETCEGNAPKGAEKLAKGGAGQNAENRFALKGHDFSRAADGTKQNWALAPEGCISWISTRMSIISATRNLMDARSP